LHSPPSFGTNDSEDGNYNCIIESQSDLFAQLRQSRDLIFLTCDAQMFEVDASRYDLKESNVRDVDTAIQLKSTQFREPGGDQVESLVSQALATAEVDLLNGDADDRCVVAENLRKALEGPVDVDQRIVDGDRRPENRIPDDFIPSMADHGATTKVAAAEIGKNVHHHFIRDPTEVGRRRG